MTNTAVGRRGIPFLHRLAVNAERVVGSDIGVALRAGRLGNTFRMGVGFVLGVALQAFPFYVNGCREFLSLVVTGGAPGLLARILGKGW
ncbi:MAG: hypothetical protein NTY38_01410 [Acidobacteria bacterium]|nr:hypothetical protein [Acidobacteriota bacterium]